MATAGQGSLAARTIVKSGMAGNSAGRGSSAARSIVKSATAGWGLSAARTIVESGMAGRESGGASAAKLFFVSVGDDTVGRRIAPRGCVVRYPLAAVTVMKLVRSAPSRGKEGSVKREGLPSLWVKICSSGGGGFMAPPPSGGGGDPESTGALWWSG